MSSPVPIRPTGMFFAMSCADGMVPASRLRCTLGVSTADGATVFTVTPDLANSTASALASAICPPLDAA